MSSQSSVVIGSKSTLIKAHRVSAPSHASLRVQARTGPVSNSAWGVHDAFVATATAAFFFEANEIARHRVGATEGHSYTITDGDVQEVFRSRGIRIPCDTRGGMSSVRAEEDENEAEPPKKKKSSTKKK